MNNGLCSKCMYPCLSKQDLHQMMKCVFPYYHFPLKIKKIILNVMYHYIVEYNDEVEEIFENIDRVILINKDGEKYDYDKMYYIMTIQFSEWMMVERIHSTI